MIESILIRYTDGDEFRMNKEISADEITRAVWLKRHDTFKLVVGNRTLYFPDKNIQVVEIKRPSPDPNDEE